MSRPALWKCRSEGCPFIFGLVRGRALTILMPGTRLDGDGNAHATCPLCKIEQVWYPKSTAAS